MTYEDEYYSTTDLYTACALRTVGYDLITIEYDSKGKGRFVFNNRSGDAESVVYQYWDRKLEIDPRAFVESINEFKTRLANRGKR